MRKNSTESTPLASETFAKWIVPGSIRAERFADLVCDDPSQVISRPLPEGTAVPEEGDLVYFASDDGSVPAFVDESAFYDYCEEHGLDGHPSDAKFGAVTYLAYGLSFAGEEVFLGGHGSQEQIDTLRAALEEPVQALIDAGILAAPQPANPSPEL